MLSDQYLLRSEALALLLFLVGPPLLVALAVQTAVFWRHQLFRRHARSRTLLAYVLTVVATPVLSVVLLSISSAPLVRLLSVRELPVAGAFFPVFPGAAVIAAVVALVVTARVLRYGRSEG